MTRASRNGRLGLLVGLAGAASVVLLMGPGVQAAQAVQGTLTGRITLTPSQQAMADLIKAEFVDAGIGFAWRAAVANAYGESALDPKAEGDGGRSIGLFQLHEDGAGKNMSKSRRRDPRLNTERIISEARTKGITRFRTTSGGELGNTTHGAMTAWFAAQVENCADCGGSAAERLGGTDTEARRRVQLLDRLFGAGTSNTIARL